jgi:hypothetical protein
VGERDQAAQHEDEAEDDGEVIGDPELAVGDRPGDTFGVAGGGCRVQKVADQSEERAHDPGGCPDPEDPAG